jgi:hypothetical protein
MGRPTEKKKSNQRGKPNQNLLSFFLSFFLFFFFFLDRPEMKILGLVGVLAAAGGASALPTRGEHCNTGRGRCDLRDACPGGVEARMWWGGHCEGRCVASRAFGLFFFFFCFFFLVFGGFFFFFFFFFFFSTLTVLTLS